MVGFQEVGNKLVNFIPLSYLFYPNNLSGSFFAVIVHATIVLHWYAFIIDTCFVNFCCKFVI